MDFVSSRRKETHEYIWRSWDLIWVFSSDNSRNYLFTVISFRENYGKIKSFKSCNNFVKAIKREIKFTKLTIIFHEN